MLKRDGEILNEENQELRFQFEAGERPPFGTYTCMNCGGHTIIVPDMAGKLPKCKKCKGTTWMKV